MTVSDEQPQEAHEVQAQMRWRRAFLAAAFLLVAVVPALAIYLYMGVQSGEWRPYVVVGLCLVLIGVAVASILLARRGRFALGAWLLIGEIVIVVPATILFVSGTGLVVGPAIVLVVAVIATSMLPRKQVGWGVIAGVLSGVAVVLLDLFGPADRLVLSMGEGIVPVVAGVAVLVLGFLVLRWIAANLASIRVLLVGSLLIVLALLVLVGVLNYVFTARMNQALVLLEEEAGRSDAVLQVDKALADFFSAMARGILSGDEVHAKELMSEATQELADSQERLEASVASLPPEDRMRSMVSQLRQGSDQMLAQLEGYLAVVDAGDWEAVMTYWLENQDEYAGHRDLMTELMDDIGGLANERKTTAVAQADATRRLMQSVPLGLGLLIVAVAAGTVLIAVRNVAQPAERLIEAAARLAAGRLDERAGEERVQEFARLAAAFNRMAEALQASHAQLEQRVADRTRDLERRTAHLEIATQVAREASAIRDIGQLLDRTVRLISESFGFYHAGIFLVDDLEEYAVLCAASSEGGRRMLERGHKLRVGEKGIVGYVAAAGEPRIALDVGDDAAFFDNPDMAQTRSEMALPLRVRGRVIGVLDVQSTEPSAFTDEDVSILQTLADQVGLAIENARLLEESQRAVQELELLYGQRVREAWQWRTARRPEAYLYTRVGVEPVAAPVEWASTPPQRRPVVLREMGGYRLVVPILLRDQTIGSIVLRREAEEEPWTQEEINLAEEVGAQIGLALENARLLEETRQRADQERITGEITARVRASMDPEAILQTAVRELGAALGTDRAFVRLREDIRPAEE